MHGVCGCHGYYGEYPKGWSYLAGDQVNCLVGSTLAQESLVSSVLYNCLGIRLLLTLTPGIHESVCGLGFFKGSQSWNPSYAHCYLVRLFISVLNLEPYCCCTVLAA